MQTHDFSNGLNSLQSAKIGSPQRFQQLKALASKLDNTAEDKNPQPGVVESFDASSGKRLHANQAEGTLSLSSSQVASKGWLKTVSKIEAEDYAAKDGATILKYGQGTESKWSVFGWTFASSSNMDSNFTSL